MSKSISRTHAGFYLCLLCVAFIGQAAAREFHVSVNGSDSNDGSSSKPLRTPPVNSVAPR